MSAPSVQSESEQIRLLELQVQLKNAEVELKKGEVELKREERLILEAKQRNQERQGPLAPDQLPRDAQPSETVSCRSVNFNTQPMRRAVQALVSSPLYDRQSRRLVPECQEGITQKEISLEFIQKVYLDQSSNDDIAEDVGNALEEIHRVLTRPGRPTTLYDIHRKAFPLESRCLLPDPDTQEETRNTENSGNTCHHHPQFTQGTDVLLLWQDTQPTNGEFDGSPRIVACGRVVCRAKGAIKCTCPQPAVKVAIVGLRDESNRQRISVPDLIYDAYNEELGVRAFTPVVQQKENNELVYKQLTSVSHLGVGQNWCWPTRLVIRDVDKETEEAQRQQKMEERAKRKIEEERKKAEKKAAQEALNTTEAKRARHIQSQTGDLESGKAALQA